MAAVKRLGFTTDDSSGNFNRYIDTKSAKDFPAVADLMLSALHDVFGVRGLDLTWGDVPLTPELQGVPSVCVPIG